MAAAASVTVAAPYQHTGALRPSAEQRSVDTGLRRHLAVGVTQIDRVDGRPRSLNTRCRYELYADSLSRRPRRHRCIHPTFISDVSVVTVSRWTRA